MLIILVIVIVVFVLLRNGATVTKCLLSADRIAAPEPTTRLGTYRLTQRTRS